MTAYEFINQFCNAPFTAPDCHQITWDLCSDIEEMFDEDDFCERQIGAAHYEVDTLLEVIRHDIPDYPFLCRMKEALEEMKEGQK